MSSVHKRFTKNILQEWTKKMSMNRKMMKIERNYFARADIVAKTFLFYAIIDCDMKISQLYNELKPRWE